MSAPAFSEEQARAYMHKLLATMSQAGGSDLFISADFPPSMKSQGAMKPLTAQKLGPDTTRLLTHSLMNEVHGQFFSVDRAELYEADAAAPNAPPADLFVFDDQLHMR